MITLDVFPETYAVCKVRTLGGVDLTAPTVFVARCEEELSLVCEASRAPADALAIEADWRMLRVRGPLDFALVGILAGLTAALAAAGVSVFAVSTFDTDYLLVREAAFPRAVEALRAAGYTVA